MIKAKFSTSGKVADEFWSYYELWRDGVNEGRPESLIKQRVIDMIDEYAKTRKGRRLTFAIPVDGHQEELGFLRDELLYWGDPGGGWDDELLFRCKPFQRMATQINKSLIEYKKAVDAGPKSKVMPIHAENGVSFLARVLLPGDKYGVDDSLTWGDGYAKNRPGVEFYDTRYPHTRFGQFTGGRYYIETLLEKGVETGHGLILHGGEPQWEIDGRSMDAVRRWLSGFAS